METVATHDGMVTATAERKVTVRMDVLSACAACQAHSRCGFADKKEKVVEIDTPDWQQYHPGDKVTVIVNARRGLLAVVIAYLLPAVLLLATFITLHCCRLSEVWVALGSLTAVGLYAGILYCFRSRLQKKFTFRLSADPLS